MGNTAEATDQDMLAPDLLPPIHPRLKVGLNLALGLVTSSCSCQTE